MSGIRLAVEWSTKRLSVATQTQQGELPESSCTVDRFHGPDAIRMLEDHFTNDGLDIRSVREIIIGRGPGNFSGIRLAFAWAAGWAAPGGVTVRACSSGHAMAHRLLSNFEPFWVIGDARRGKWWGCAVRNGTPGDWRLETPDTWQQEIGDGQVFSSEAGRLTGLLNVQEAYPTATDLLNFPGGDEPLEPLYLHPAV